MGPDQDIGLAFRQLVVRGLHDQTVDFLVASFFGHTIVVVLERMGAGVEVLDLGMRLIDASLVLQFLVRINRKTFLEREVQQRTRRPPR